MDVKKLKNPARKEVGTEKPAEKKPSTEEKRSPLHKLLKFVSFLKEKRHGLFE